MPDLRKIQQSSQEQYVKQKSTVENSV